MTADEMVDQALGRVGEVTRTYPSSRGPMYQRIGVRQRWCFAYAAQTNPERFGTAAFGNLQTVSGLRVLDINDIVAPVPTPELIQRVEIENKGTSPYTNGDEVTIVTVEDKDAELPPRAFLRDGVVIGVGTDLDLITSLRIYYPKLTDLFLATDKDKVLDLLAPWDTLLELDLAKWVLGKATQLSAETRVAAITALAAEETILLADFKESVANYTPSVSRFAPPRVYPRS
jgi:hypothetical protein